MFPFTLGLWKRQISKQDAVKRVNDILDAVGLTDKKDMYPDALSGGQNQRVALARALVLQPRILLMDEPFGALDAQTREEMQSLLGRLYDKQPCTIVFVTHDVTEALLLGDRVIILSSQPAKIADDFQVPVERKDRATWLRTPSGQSAQQRILSTLHSTDRTSGRVSVSV